GGAIFAGQPQAGCPAQKLNSCGAIVKVDSTGKVQWANDLLFATSATPYSSPLTWPFDIQQTNDGGFVLVGYANAPSENYNPWIAKLTSTGKYSGRTSSRDLLLLHRIRNSRFQA